MKTRTVIAAFALALAAGASQAAQDSTDNRPHGPHGERMDNGGGQRGAVPQAAPQAAPQAPPQGQGAPRQGFDQRGQRPAGPVQAAPAAAAAPSYRSDRGAGPGRTEGYRGADQRNDGYRGGDQRNDGYRGAQSQDRGQDRGDRRDGRFDGGPRNEGRWDQRRDGDNRNWERGRYPPVYQSDRRFRINPYRYPQGYYARSWGFGDFLPRGWFGSDYLLGDFYSYGLPYPPAGYEWVRVGPDAVMIDRYTGRVVQVVRYVFW